MAIMPPKISAMITAAMYRSEHITPRSGAGT